MILIVDDDPSVVTSLTLLLKQAGFQSQGVSSPDAAVVALADGAFELVLLDMNFSRQTTGEEGLVLLKAIKEAYPNLPVILMTAWGSIALAVEGMKLGAADFVSKPWSNEHVVQVVKTALHLVDMHQDNDVNSLTREKLDDAFDFAGIVGQDPKMLEVLDLVGRVSATDASVLITGENGTGKEGVAEALHRNSQRVDAAFVKVNLGGISSTLFESEMFGHVKGAFTDAQQDRSGRFALADGGTIFLDEIGDLDLNGQVKLLRVLQDRTYEVLGSSQTRSVDVRVISATNRVLSEMVSEGTFREDLLYRLNLIVIHLPALRDRVGDISLLTRHFLMQIGQRYGQDHLDVTDGAMDWLKGQNWPGNVRQLLQVIERAVLMVKQSVLDVDIFERAMAMQAAGEEGDMLPPVGSMTLDEIERGMILRALAQYENNISKVADALGVSRAALYRRLNRYGIEP